MKLNEVHNIDEAMMAGGQEAYATEAKLDAYTRDQMAATSGFGRKPREHDTGDDEPKGVFTVVIDGRDWKTATSNEAFRMASAVARKHPGKRVQVRWPTGQLNTVAEALSMGMEEEFVGEPEHDGSTFKNSLHTIHRVAVYLNKNISADDDIPEWVAEKMGAAKGMLTSVMQYLISEKEMHSGESGMFEQGMTEGLDGRASATPAINKRGKFTSWDENEPMRLKCQDGEFRTIQEINVLRQKMGMKPFSIKGEQGVAEDDAGDVEQRMRIKIEREKQRLAQLKQSDPAAYQREMAKRNTSSKIPPVSTFEQQGVAEGADTHWIPDVVVLLKKLLLSSKAQAKYYIEPQDIPEIKKLIKLLRTGNLDAARELWDLMETYDLDNALEYYVRKNGLPHVWLHKLLGDQGVAEGFGAPASAGPKAQRVTIISGPDVGQSGWLGKMSPQDAQKYPGYVLVHLNHGGGSTMLPKSAVKIDQGVAEGEANAGVTLRSQIIKLYKRGLEDYDIAYDLDIDEKIVADIIDDYDRKQQQRHAKKQGVANSMPQGNYSDEAHPIRDDGNELPDYAAMYESKLVEFAGGMGAGSVATAPGVGKGSNVGSLFGGSYSPKNSPFKAKKPKKSGMIKR